MEPYFIAQICMFGGNFAPRSWAYCQGQLMSIAQNSALFALLGTTYGGDGLNTFALPDLRGRIPVGAGQGPGLSPKIIGEMSGTPSVTLNISNLPVHTHTAVAQVAVNTATGNTNSPGNAFISGGPANTYAPATHATGNLGGVVAQVLPAGNSQPFSNYMPSLGINFIIALEGIFPSRN